MAEKTPNQQLAEKLLYKPAYVADKDADVKQKAHDFAEGYKKFLDAGKTEREVAAESEQMLKDAGYQQFDPKKPTSPATRFTLSSATRLWWLPPSVPRALRMASIWSLPTPTAPVWTCVPPRCMSLTT